ncbi:hypothetical protein B0H13DRAFT_2199960, partial [Mycena leptocephala]
MLWEYATFLPDEIKLYRKPVWTTISPYGFLALRYGGILATLPVVFLSATKTSGCQAAASLSQVGVVLVVTSSATIFGARTYSLWSNSRIVGGLLGGLLAVMTACWITLASQYQAVAVPKAPFGSNCRVLPAVSWLPLGNICFAIFLVTALILTLLKMPQHHHRDSPIRLAYLISRANVAYLVGTTLTAMIALVIQSSSPRSSALLLSTGPIATVLTVAFGTCAFRDFAMPANAPAPEAEHADALSMSTPRTSESVIIIAPPREKHARRFP